MSVQAITQALAIQGVSPSEKLLLMVLANYADDTGKCWPSQTRLAEDTCMTDRGVRKLLVALEAKGLVSRKGRNRRDGSQGTDLINLTLAGYDHRNHVPPEPRSTGTSVQDHRNQSDKSPEPGSALTTFEPSRTTIEPSNNARASAFERFWRAYPSKVGKRAAQAAFAKAAQRAPPDRIIAGVQTALAECDQWRRGFIPNPTTWLNQDRWTDEHAPPPVSDKLAQRHENYRRAFAGASAAFDAPDFDR